MRFSEFFKLGVDQSELDFVDILLQTDIELFADPYAFSLEEGEWFQQCQALIVDYFDRVVAAIANGNGRHAQQLLGKLAEPNDTHLGYSTGQTGPAGRGVGRDQASLIYNALTRSKAATSGNLQDLSDCELYIPGIGPDKISDITINIIRGNLVEFTEEECAKQKIPTRRVASGLYWSPKHEYWVNRYAHLPIYNGKPIVLIPKNAVRYRIAANHKEYYQHYVLDYLQAEHSRPGDSLARVLRSGRLKVYKKDLTAEYPVSKEFLFDFSLDHPKVYQRYKNSLGEIARRRLQMGDITRRQEQSIVRDLQKRVTDLTSIPPGNKDAGKYHDLIFGALEGVFSPTLHTPVKEQPVDEGRKRIDITFTNSANGGFFDTLVHVHRVKAPYIFFECKNYSGDPANPEFDQLTGRFNPDRGLFGILVCRKVTDRALMIARCRDIVHSRRGYVIVLDDPEMLQLIQFRIDGNSTAIERLMEHKFAELVL